MHKIQSNWHVEDLPIRPIVSNIRTITYDFSKYLAKMLAQLRKSQYSLKNTKDFMNKIKAEQIPTGYRMFSIDVKSIFTNAPLDLTIHIILQRIFDNQEIQTTMTKKELKELLIICIKNVHFPFGGNAFVQSDGVTMCSPLGPMSADIFMVELEITLVPTLTEYKKFWERYMDDTVCFVKMGSVEYIVLIL